MLSSRVVAARIALLSVVTALAAGVVLLTNVPTGVHAQEESVAQRIERAFTELSAAPYRASQTYTGKSMLTRTRSIETSGTYEITYQPTDRTRIVGQVNGNQSIEIIAIGTNAWVRSGNSDWQTVSAPATRAQAFDSTQGLDTITSGLNVAVTFDGPGPELAGEPTERYGVRRSDYGNELIDVIESTLTNDPLNEFVIYFMRSLFRNTAIEYDIFVGATTGRIHRMETHVSGPVLETSSVTVFSDFGVANTITQP